MLRNKIQLTCLLLIVSIGTITAQTQAKLIPKKGLFLETNGLTWGMGSEVNFFTSDRKQHHYYFTWWEQDILVDKPNDTRLELGSRNTAIYGIYQLERNENKIRTWIDCKWNRGDSGLAEITFVRIWKPYFREAQWRNEKGELITDWSRFHDRRIFAETPFGTFEFYSSVPFKAKVIENSTPSQTEYTHRSQYIEFYEDKISIDSTRMLQRAFFIHELGKKETGSPQTHKSMTLHGNRHYQTVSNSWLPILQKNPILPQPEQVIPGDGFYTLPLTKHKHFDSIELAFRKLLSLNWQIGDQHYPKIQCRKNDSLLTQAYRIEIGKNRIDIQYGSDTAIQYALQTLVQAVEVKEGRLRIPCMTLQDKPKTNWRGIHMFTGPTALDLHTRMFERVLFPLKMNKAVIQCEQAQWKSFPEIHNPISVSLSDLKKEFELLRRNRVEPIPLIQSLGHMEWFFKPTSTRWLAINPQYPYTLNSDLPQAKESIRKIWDEAIDLLEPTTLHVGFDEIGMIGFHLPREKEVDLFKDQLSFLNQYAIRRNKKLMIWGDMGLAPGEAPDACNGIDPARAKTIREAIPSGTYVADWHYLNNANPAVYKKSLEIWKQNQNIPLASPWLWPNNVRGFVKAAIDEQVGVLQTTWADFESSEKNMLINIEQFGAYVLALDYAWSGRQELPTQLPYDPILEWTRRFYDQSKPLTARTGYMITDSIRFLDITSANKISFLEGADYHGEKIDATGIAFEGYTASILPEGSLIAEIELIDPSTQAHRKYPIRYGVEVRSKNDARPVYAALDPQNKRKVWQFWHTATRYSRLTIKQLNPGAGLVIRQLQFIR